LPHAVRDATIDAGPELTETPLAVEAPEKAEGSSTGDVPAVAEPALAARAVVPAPAAADEPGAAATVEFGDASAVETESLAEPEPEEPLPTAELTATEDETPVIEPAPDAGSFEFAAGATAEEARDEPRRESEANPRLDAYGELPVRRETEEPPTELEAPVHLPTHLQQPERMHQEMRHDRAPEQTEIDQTGGEGGASSHDYDADLIDQPRGLRRMLSRNGQVKEKLVEAENDRILSLRELASLEPPPTVRDGPPPRPSVAHENRNAPETDEKAAGARLRVIEGENEGEYIIIDSTESNGRQIDVEIPGADKPSFRIWRRSGTYVLEQLDRGISISGEEMMLPVVLLDDGDEIAVRGYVMRFEVASPAGVEQRAD
jgi:hypothetical protein